MHTLSHHDALPKCAGKARNISHSKFWHVMPISNEFACTYWEWQRKRQPKINPSSKCSITSQCVRLSTRPVTDDDQVAQLLKRADVGFVRCEDGDDRCWGRGRSLIAGGVPPSCVLAEDGWVVQLRGVPNAWKRRSLAYLHHSLMKAVLHSLATTAAVSTFFRRS